MAGGVRLGGAYFELEASAAPLIQALAQAESASQKSVQAIAQATGVVEKDVQRFAQTYIAAEKQRADAAAAATLKIIKAHNDEAAAASKSSGGFADLLKGGLALGAGLAGVQLGLEGVKKGLEFVAEETGKAAQAQFALNALYGAASPIITKFAEDQAVAFGRSKADAKEAAASVATLTRNYALSSEQTERVLTISANLAAVRGISLAQASERVQSALRGEAEAIEYLGQALGSNALKAFGQMTDAQRKNFESLNDISKAQIILANLTNSTSDLQGKAAERMNTAAGATENLKGRTADLAATLGGGLSPEIAKAENAMAGWIKKLDEVIQKSQEAAKNQRVVNAGLTHGIVDVEPGSIQVGPDAGLPGGGSGPTPAQAQAAAGGRAAAKRAEADAKDRAAAAKKVHEQEAKDGVEVAEAVHRREVKDLDDRKVLLEAEKEAKLRTVEAEKTAALAGIETEARAAKAASDAKIAGLRVEEEAAKRSAQVKHEDAVKGIDAEQRAVKDAADENIRNLEIERDRDKQASEDKRDAAIRDLDLVKRERDDARLQEDRSEEDSITKRTRAETDRHTHETRDLEDEAKAAQVKHDARVRHLDDEATKAEKSHDRAVRSIEKESRAEDDRHTGVLRGLKDEEDARLKILDIQLQALDATEKAEQNAEKTANLQKAVADAQSAVTKAHGTGTPADIAGARGDLTAALKGGDAISIANARERLNQLAGQGTEAIKKADEDLAKAQQDLRDEGVKETRDAQREQIKSAQDAVKDEIALRKQAEDDQNDARKRDLDADKRAADDKLKRVKDGVTASKQAADDSLKSVKDGLDKQKQAEQDTHDKNVQLLQDQTLKEKREIDDRRRTEDQADQDRRKELQDAYDLEERLRHARYDAEDTGEIPAIKRAATAAEDGFRVRKTAADDAYRDEQQHIQDTYTNEQTGLIPVAERAAAAVAQGFHDQAHAVELETTAQKQNINDVYSNAAKTGLIDLIEQARKDSEEKLQNQRDYWRDWAKDLAGPDGYIQQVIGKTDDLINKIKELGNAPGVKVSADTGQQNGPADPFPGGGNEHDTPGGGPGPGVGAGSDTVPEPYQVQFPFGARYDDPFSASIPIHRGVDLTVKGAPNGGKGSPVEAFEDGEVTYQDYDKNGGNGVIIRGEDGLYHRYFHFDSVNVSRGDTVHRGDVIGTLGESGTEGSPHLHYEVSKNESGDPIGDLIDPVPYMNKGGASRQQGGQTFEFDLFGRHFTVTLPFGASGDALIRQIEALGERIGGKEFGRAAASIALSEGANGDLTRAGTGGARGPFQFDPGGKLPEYAAYLHKDVDAAGDYAGTHPMDAAAWALRGYLGDALRDGIDQNLKGADLAEWGSLYGQAPYGDNYKRAGDASRQLWGYRHGGWISPNSMIIDAAGSPYARTEGFAERVLSPEQSARWDGGGTTIHEGDISVTGIGLDEVAADIERRQNRQRLLRGVAGTVRRR